MPAIEIFDTDAEQTQNKIEAKPTKTTKPRSRSQKSTAGAASTAGDPSSTSSAELDTPALEPDKKPARKPRARKKSTTEAISEAATDVTSETGTLEAASLAEFASSTGAEKPKRTRRGGKGRKRADTPEATESTAPSILEPTTPEQTLLASEQSAPVHPASEQSVSERTISEQASLFQTSPYQFSSGQFSFGERAAPANATPEAPLELAAAPERLALEAAPSQSALETSSRRTALPALTKYSPAPNAPTLILPQASGGNDEGDTASGIATNTDDADADADAASPSKSRSRSARRRKAARKRAEAAAQTSTEAVAQATRRRGVSAFAHEIFDAEDDNFTIDIDIDTPLDSLESSDSLEYSESSASPSTSSTSRRSRRGRGKKIVEKDAVETAIDASPNLDSLDASTDFEDDFEDDYEDDGPTVQPRADRKMLVSVLPGELVEVVIMDDGRVQEYYVEMEHQAKIRGNIYKGVVSNVDVNLQAAFVNYGNVKNGFLQIDEVHPEYWLTHHEVTKGHKYPPIQKVMKPGQEVLVQVVKEPSGAKGAFLTTWVSLAGRFLVLTPGQEQIGISRKVEDGEERNRLRELIKGLNPGEGLGAIVRTVSAGTSKTTLQKDLSFLKRVWKDIRKRAGSEKAPSLIYKEPSLATRAVRDYLSDDVSEICVDDAETAEAIRDMTSLLFPRKADLLHLHQDSSKTLWEQFKVRKYLDQIHAREVYLPSGGRLVFDQTEALMAIDINSGKTSGKTNFESMALRTNVEAAEMIAHQLRLRDVGGQVVIDFIEMRDQSHCREVEKTMRNAMKGDRARYDIGKMSSFGLMQIVRQRIGSSAISISQEPCPHCTGTGLRRNMEWQSLQILRDLRVQLRSASITGQSEFLLQLEAELAVYILNHKRERLCALEKEFGVRLEIKVGLE